MLCLAKGFISIERYESNINQNDGKPMREKQWFWMMEYCKKKCIPPAQEWAWSEAAKAYAGDNVQILEVAEV